MRRGTWTETGGGSGGGGLGLVVVGVVAGLWLLGQAKPSSRAPAVESAPSAPAAPVREAVAAQASQGGHGVGWWALVVACLVLAVVVLTVAGLVLLDRTARRRHDGEGPDTPSLPAVLDTDNGGLPGDGSVVHLSDYAAGDARRRTAAGGEDR